MAEAKKEKKERGGQSGLFIPAGLFIGIGFGFLFGNLPAGVFIGLGVGFALFASFMLARNGN